MTAGFILATPVAGRNVIHREGCRHIHRLWLGGGGAITSGSTIAELEAQNRDEFGYTPRKAPCTKEAPRCWLFANGWAETSDAEGEPVPAGYMDGGAEQASECASLRGAQTCSVHASTAAEERGER